jgi:hypothetical protein
MNSVLDMSARSSPSEDLLDLGEAECLQASAASAIPMRAGSGIGVGREESHVSSGPEFGEGIGVSAAKRWARSGLADWQGVVPPRDRGQAVQFARRQRLVAWQRRDLDIERYLTLLSSIVSVPRPQGTAPP